MMGIPDDNDKLSRAMNLTPIEKRFMTDETTDIIVPEPEIEGGSVVETYEKEIRTVDKIINTAEAATSEMYDIAYSSQGSRDYEVLAKLLKTTSDLNRDRAALKKERAIEHRKGSPKDEPNQSINNTVHFHGTAAEMLAQLKKMREQD